MSAQIRLFFWSLPPHFFQQWHREYCPSSISWNCCLWLENCLCMWLFDTLLTGGRFVEYFWVQKHMHVPLRHIRCLKRNNERFGGSFRRISGLGKLVWLIRQTRYQTLGHSALPRALCARCLTPGAWWASEHTIKQLLLMSSAAKEVKAFAWSSLAAVFSTVSALSFCCIDSVPTTPASIWLTAFFTVVFLVLKGRGYRLMKSFTQYFKLDFQIYIYMVNMWICFFFFFVIFFSSELNALKCSNDQMWSSTVCLASSDFKWWLDLMAEGTSVLQMKSNHSDCSKWN